jgi:hypothetical protein
VRRADSLKEAFVNHQQGCFRNADRLYSEVLEQQPNDADAIHLSAIFAMLQLVERRGHL